MRNLKELDRFRVRNRVTSLQNVDEGIAGAFEIPSPNRTLRTTIRVIATVGDGWDHVSVSLSIPRTPTWKEMEYIKRMFFKANETAMQLHVPSRDHINNHEHTLHLWRPLDQDIPRPPAWMV